MKPHVIARMKDSAKKVDNPHSLLNRIIHQLLPKLGSIFLS